MAIRKINRGGKKCRRRAGIAGGRGGGIENDERDIQRHSRVRGGGMAGTIICTY